MRAPSQDSQRDDAGHVAGRYQLGEVLGRGGMADVYRATDRLLDRDVAVKLLRETADESGRARFTAEARTLAQLSHSGLVMVLDAGVTAERPYLIMELVEGPTLARVLAAGPVDLERATSVGVQLAEALAYAHDHGVVHRDVKPGNVLLGPDGVVKLADFGIARLIGDTVRHTRPGQAIGTAAYLAPEQVTGRPVDGAADVYALGLVLLEAMTGERAYPGSPTEAAVARLTRQPDIPVELPGEWRRLLAEMTALEPGDRPTASDAAARLRKRPSGLVPTRGRHLPRQPGTTQPITSPAALPAAPPPMADRAGDALAGVACRAVGRARAMPSHQLGVAAAVAAIILLIVVVASVAGSAGGGGSAQLPPDTPPQLRQPLADLHEAVTGG